MPSIPLAPRCPIRTTLELLGGKWSLLTLDRLSEGPLPYGDLKQKLHPISDKVLTQTLRRLAEDQLLVNKNGRYHRTPAGEATEPLLTAIVSYAKEYERLRGIESTLENKNGN